MKRSFITALLLSGTALFGATLGARADTDIYANTTKYARSYAALQSDTDYCNEVVGAPQNHAQTPIEYKQCMRDRGWRFRYSVWEHRHRWWLPGFRYD